MLPNQKAPALEQMSQMICEYHDHIIIIQMSLVQQLLQQNLHRQLSHQLIEQLQQQASSVELLIHNLDSLKTVNKVQAVESKIEMVLTFIQLKKDISQLVYPSTTSENIQRWIRHTFEARPILLNLVEAEKAKFVMKIASLANELFLTERTDSLPETYLRALEGFHRRLLNQEQINHHLLTDIDEIGYRFLEQKHRFEGKVQEFNRQVLMVLESMAYFERRILRQFGEMLEVEEQPVREANQNQRAVTINDKLYRAESESDVGYGNFY